MNKKNKVIFIIEELENLLQYSYPDLISDDENKITKQINTLWVIPNKWEQYSNHHKISDDVYEYLEQLEQ